MSEDGFTLLEIIVVITITGLILGAAFSLLQQGLATWDRVGRLAEWEQQHRVLGARFKKDLHNLFYADLYPEYEFKGDYQGLQLIVRQGDRLYQVSYSADYYYNQLVRKALPTVAKANKKREQPLAEELRFFNHLQLYRVEFSFFDPKKRYWVTSWSYQESAYLPQLVSLHIRTADFELPPISAAIYIGQQY